MPQAPQEAPQKQAKVEQAPPAPCYLDARSQANAQQVGQRSGQAAANEGRENIPQRACPHTGMGPDSIKKSCVYNMKNNE